MKKKTLERHDYNPVHEPVVGTVFVEGSVKPAKHRKGTHTFSVVGMALDPRYLHQSILLRCLPCKVRVGVDTCRLLTFSIDAPLEEIIAGLQSVITDQDKKDICHGDVPASTKRAVALWKAVKKATSMATHFFKQIVYGPGMSDKMVLFRARETLEAFKKAKVL